MTATQTTVRPLEERLAAYVRGEFLEAYEWDYDLGRAAARHEWQKNREADCRCTPVLHTADGSPGAFYMVSETQGCPLHCGHSGLVWQEGAICRCGCVVGYS